ncbi:hypothetical protein HanIR_Chr06g0257971 [Helianthus annuus]|nr:hypothetical protein HanIR_Chr06g0257971 [Helianthus annuus]
MGFMKAAIKTKSHHHHVTLVLGLEIKTSHPPRYIYTHKVERGLSWQPSFTQTKGRSLKLAA